MIQYKVVIAMRDHPNVDLTVWYRVQTSTPTRAIALAMAQRNRDGFESRVRRLTVTMERVVAPGATRTLPTWSWTTLGNG